MDDKAIGLEGVGHFPIEFVHDKRRGGELEQVEQGFEGLIAVGEVDFALGTSGVAGGEGGLEGVEEGLHLAERGIGEALGGGEAGFFGDIGGKPGDELGLPVGFCDFDAVFALLGGKSPGFHLSEVADVFGLEEDVDFVYQGWELGERLPESLGVQTAVGFAEGGRVGGTGGGGVPGLQEGEVNFGGLFAGGEGGVMGEEGLGGLENIGGFFGPDNFVGTVAVNFKR